MALGVRVDDMPTHLTDEQTWAIVNAPDELNARQIADQLGLTYSAVVNRRWQIRKDGWSCKVHWEPCQECGEPLIERRRRQLYHDRCRLAVSKRLDASYAEDRRYSDQQIQARGERREAHYRHGQEVTRPHATSHMRRYTPEDDALLLELNKTMTHEQIALEVGRTKAAVQTRLKHVKLKATVSYTEPPTRMQ